MSSNMQTASAGVDSIRSNIGGIVAVTQQANSAAREVKEAARVLSD